MNFPGLPWPFLAALAPPGGGDPIRRARAVHARLPRAPRRAQGGAVPAVVPYAPVEAVHGGGKNVEKFGPLNFYMVEKRDNFRRSVLVSEISMVEKNVVLYIIYNGIAGEMCWFLMVDDA